MSPLIFNIALGPLDEHLTGPWKTRGQMSTASRRATRRRNGLPNWRIVRYADDFAVLTDGTEQDTQALREQIAQVLAMLGLRFSEAKTRVVHMSEGATNLRYASLRSVSVVGARAATRYGSHVCTEMAASLAERSWTLLSGGAYTTKPTTALTPGAPGQSSAHCRGGE